MSWFHSLLPYTQQKSGRMGRYLNFDLSAQSRQREIAGCSYLRDWLIPDSYKLFPSMWQEEASTMGDFQNEETGKGLESQSNKCCYYEKCYEIVCGSKINFSLTSE